MAIQFIANGRAVNPRVLRLVAAAPKIGAALLFTVKLVLLSELLAFWFVIALGGFDLAILPESNFRKLTHGGAINVGGVTVLRGVCVVLVICAVFGGVWCCRTIVSIARANWPLARLLGAVAFAFFMALFDWLVLSSLQLYHGDNGPLWCAAGGTFIAAGWLWSAVRDLRRPAAA